VPAKLARQTPLQYNFVTNPSQYFPEHYSNVNANQPGRQVRFGGCHTGTSSQATKSVRLAMFVRMAGIAQRNQVELGVVPCLTAGYLMVHLQVSGGATILTFPAVPV
jgi:hypothetical protein